MRTALVLHPREGKAALLDAELLGHGGHGGGGGVVLLVQDEAQVLFAPYPLYVSVRANERTDERVGVCIAVRILRGNVVFSIPPHLGRLVVGALRPPAAPLVPAPANKDKSGIPI